MQRGVKFRYFKLTSLPVSYRGKVVSFMTLVDITDEERLRRKLEYTATHDYLTKALNRHGFFPAFEHLIAQSERYGTPLSLILFDIDNFKKINDTYGHQLGDEVLKRLVKIIRGLLRRSDLLVRYGGEEFVVVLPMTQDPTVVVEKIRRSVEEDQMLKRYSVTISAGATTYRKGDTPDSMLARADTALYRAKAEGKNRIVFI